MARTATAIQADIDIFREAIRNIALSGQSYTITTGSSTRTFTSADIDKLRDYLNDLENELADVNGNSGIMTGF